MTEELKRTGQMGWIRSVNSIISRAEEIIRQELIYVQHSLIQMAGGVHFGHPFCCIDIACEANGMTELYRLCCSSVPDQTIQQCKRAAAIPYRMAAASVITKAVQFRTKNKQYVKAEHQKQNIKNRACEFCQIQ